MKYRIAFAGLMIFAVLVLGITTAWSHGGKTDKQGCHKVKATGEEHCHVTAKGEKVKIIKAQAPKIQRVEVPGPERIVEKRVEVKHVRVKKFEAAMADVLSRLERAIRAEANRPAKVATVTKEVLVRDNTKATAECVKLRREYLSAVNTWGGSDETIGKKAIKQGCW